MLKETDVAFEVNIGQKVGFLSFSQRRFLGFRNRYEFDKRRILAASLHDMTVLGLDINDSPYLLYKGSLLD